MQNDVILSCYKKMQYYNVTESLDPAVRSAGQFYLGHSNIRQFQEDWVFGIKM